MCKVPTRSCGPSICVTLHIATPSLEVMQADVQDLPSATSLCKMTKLLLFGMVVNCVYFVYQHNGYSILTGVFMPALSWFSCISLCLRGSQQLRTGCILCRDSFGSQTTKSHHHRNPDIREFVHQFLGIVTMNVPAFHTVFIAS